LDRFLFKSLLAGEAIPMGTKKQEYTEDFKRLAVELAEEIGASAAAEKFWDQVWHSDPRFQGSCLGRVLISLDLTRKILSEANESRAGKGRRRRTQRYVEVDFDEHVSVANEKTFAVV
jgi:hypothetical protein